MEFYADLVWTDHVAWCPMPRAHTRVIDLPDTGRFVATARGQQLDVIGLDAVGNTPVVDFYRAPTDLSSEADAMVKPLADLGTVARVRTADLWEAIGAALCHHSAVKRPWHAYKDLCRDGGEQVPLPDSPRYAMFPTPDVIASETPISMAGTGLGDVAGLLCDAADTYMRYAPEWTTAAPKDLITRLHAIDGIGEHAARQIAVDITGDFSSYPHDAEFRSWAGRIAPNIPWPTNKEDFTTYWTRLTEPHTSGVTALLVASATNQK